MSRARAGVCVVRLFDHDRGTRREGELKGQNWNDDEMERKTFLINAPGCDVGESTSKIL